MGICLAKPPTAGPGSFRSRRQAPPAKDQLDCIFVNSDFEDEDRPSKSTPATRLQSSVKQSKSEGGQVQIQEWRDKKNLIRWSTFFEHSDALGPLLTGWKSRQCVDGRMMYHRGDELSETSWERPGTRR